MIMSNTLSGAAIVERARAFAARHRPATSVPDQPKAGRTVEDLVRQMSDDMLDVEAVTGSVTEEDLLRRGWSMAALRKIGAAARDRANRASRRRA